LGATGRVEWHPGMERDEKGMEGPYKGSDRKKVGRKEGKGGS